MEPLFTVTKEHLETGLRGIPVGYCVTSKVDPEKGLFYADYPISELSTFDPEEVIYLLMHGEKGSKDALLAFKKALKARAFLDPRVEKAIQQLPREGHPMALFSAALLIAGMFEGVGDYEEDCLNMIAKIPLITASVISHHAGWMTNRSDLNLDYIENFVQMLGMPNKDEKQLSTVMRLFNILHYDHGGGNLSAFVGKAVASGLEDLYGSISAAMNALAGPRHGKANQECLQFLKELKGKLGDSVDEGAVEALLRQKIQDKELIYGFGHAVLRVEDPRASVQYDYAKQHFSEHPLVQLALLLREVGPKVLKENPKVSNPYPNVDAISGALLTAAGFDNPDYYTVLFGMSRLVGIAVQIVYERVVAREGRGTPIVRPKYLYKPRGSL